MRLDYYLYWTTGENEQKMAMALDMLEDAPLSHVAVFTGVPKSVIVKAAKEMGLGQHLKNQKRFDLIVADLEEEVTPEAEPNETREERFKRLHNALSNYQNKCQHDMFHVRCSKCMKILGSELHYKTLKEIEVIIKDSLNDNWGDDEKANIVLEKYYRTLIQKLHEAITTKEKE